MAATAAKTDAPAPAIPAKADAPAAPKAVLREQPKKFPPSSLQPLGQDFEMLAIKVPDDWTMEDLLKPVAWANVANIVAKDALNTRRDKIGSLIYARSTTLKAILTIEGIELDQFGQARGLKVEVWLK